MFTYPLSMIVNGTVSASPPARVAIHSKNYSLIGLKLTI